MKDKNTELLSVYHYLQKQPATATQAAIALNIYRPSLCIYKRRLEKQGKLAQLKKVICPITKYPAHQLTCDPGLINNAQLKIFEGVVNNG